MDMLAEGREGSPSASPLLMDGIVDLVLFPLPRNAKIRGFARLITPVRGQEEVTHFSPALWLWATDEWCLGPCGHVGSSGARCVLIGHSGARVVDGFRDGSGSSPRQSEPRGPCRVHRGWTFPRDCDF